MSDLVKCLTCGEEFVTVRGERCVDCFPEDHTEMTETQTSLFSGDWEWNGIFEAYETAFYAEDFDAPWNGFCTPVVTREILRLFAARQVFFADVGALQIQEDGNGFRVYSEDPNGPEESWLMPDEHGLFHLRELGFTFERLDAGDHERVIRAVV